jgi:hypothetical protein
MIIRQKKLYKKLTAEVNFNQIKLKLNLLKKLQTNARSSQ